MPASPHVPDALRAGPFRGAEALAAGLTRRQLRSDCWRHLFHDVYAWAGLADDFGLRIAAAALLLPPGAAFSHRTAAWLHGVRTLSAGPAPEVVVPTGTTFAAGPGIVVRHAPLPATEVVSRRLLPVTAAERTAFDLSRTESASEAVACVDAFLHDGLAEQRSLACYVAAKGGWRGVRLAAAAVDLGDAAAESPMESRLRMVLIEAGLPRPVVNEPLYDSDGTFLGRPDLRIRHVLVEYDGSVHRVADVFGQDLRRQNRLVDAGYVVLRYGAGDVSDRPGLIVDQVRRRLADGSPILFKSTSWDPMTG